MFNFGLSWTRSSKDMDSLEAYECLKKLDTGRVGTGRDGTSEHSESLGAILDYEEKTRECATGRNRGSFQLPTFRNPG